MEEFYISIGVIKKVLKFIELLDRRLCLKNDFL